MDWTHSPIHRTGTTGCYFLTAGTYQKAHFLGAERYRDTFVATIKSLCALEAVLLHAWVVLSNHYHLIISRDSGLNIPLFIKKLHSLGARDLNAADGTPGRKVWYQYWDKELTIERSYLARLNYIHQNPVHHGVVWRADLYRWSSLREFEESADAAFVRTVRAFKTDSLNVFDPF